MQEEKGEVRIVAKSSRRWTWPRMLRQVLRLCKVEKSGDTQGTLSTWLEEHRRLAARENTIKTQRRVLKCENRCNVGREYEETRSGRSEPGTLEFPWKSQECKETRRYRKPGHRRYWQDLATQSPYIYCLRTTYWEGFLERETKIWSQSRRQKWKISMWMRLYGEQLCPSLFKLQLILDEIIREVTFHVESVYAIIETVDSTYWETDHGSDRNYKYSSDRLAAANVAKDNLAGWQGSPVRDCTILCLFRFSAVTGRHQFRPRQSMEGQD